jgi:hypothetical protein
MRVAHILKCDDASLVHVDALLALLDSLPVGGGGVFLGAFEARVWSDEAIVAPENNSEHFHHYECSSYTTNLVGDIFIFRDHIYCVYVSRNL